MSALHIYLNSSDAGNHFDLADFIPFKNQFPNCKLVIHKNEEALLTALPDIEWLDTWHFNADWYALAPKLKAIFTPAAGRNWIACEAGDRVQIFHGEFHGTMIAESLLGLMLHFNRLMSQMRDLQDLKIWDRNIQQPGRLLANQSALILGYGNIGKTCGKLLTALGMQVFGHQRTHRGGIDQSSGVSYVHQDDLKTYLPKVDHVILLLPGDDSTRHFMSRDLLSSMKASAYIYNFGRGTTLAESDLLWALDKGCIKGAGLDVTEIEPLPNASRLWQHKDVVLLPHSSCVFREYQQLHVDELCKCVTNTKLLQSIMD